MRSRAAEFPLRKWSRRLAISGIGVLLLMGCAGDPVLPGSTQPTGTLLIEGTVPQTLAGLSTYSFDSGRLISIASRVSAPRDRLSPDGRTVFSFSGGSPEDVYRLVSAQEPNATIPLLQFPAPDGTNASGLAVKEDRGIPAVGFLETSSSPLPDKSIFRVHRVGTAGWSDTLLFLGKLAGLSWHPDGRRLVTTVFEAGFTGAGRVAIVDLTSQSVSMIGPREAVAGGDAELSPDGGTLVYSRVSDDGLTTELVSMGFEGGREIPLPPHFEGWMPAFSPDGRYLAFCKSVQVGINRLRGRFILRIADGQVEQILPPDQYPTLGCIHDWVK
ncbi:MAG: hypothetical protein ABJC19_05570 [Gemmatimonadota bacterium]